jgi:hypothetical protein
MRSPVFQKLGRSSKASTVVQYWLHYLKIVASVAAFGGEKHREAFLLERIDTDEKVFRNQY